MKPHKENVNGVMAKSYAMYRRLGKLPELALKRAISDRKWAIQGLEITHNLEQMNEAMVAEVCFAKKRAHISAAGITTYITIEGSLDENF